MAIMNCKICGAHLSSNAKSCPKCGAPKNKAIGITIFEKGIRIFISLSITIVGIALLMNGGVSSNIPFWGVIFEAAPVGFIIGGIAILYHTLGSNIKESKTVEKKDVLKSLFIFLFLLSAFLLLSYLLRNF
jgi:hypothetical protein